MLSAAWLLTFSTLLQGTPAQAAGPSSQPEISITAVVTDRRGRPVADLGREDFTLRDQGAQQPVSGAQFKRGGGRLFAIFFDEYHVGAGDSTGRAREALSRFVDEQTRPADLFVAMKPLDPIAAIHPTADRSIVRGAIDGFAGCMGDYTPRTPFEAEYMSRAPQAAASERARVVLSALVALTSRLGSVQDMPKAVVFVAETAGGDLRAVAHAANRSGVAVYVIDPRGTPSDPSATLSAVAQDTGGTMTAGGADLGPTLSRIARDLDAYYVLTYRPTAAADGKFHTLQVGTRRPGFQVRGRGGYWSPMPAPRRASGPSGSFPIGDMLAAHVSSLIQPWFRMTRGPQGRTRITFSWQPSQASAAAKSPAPEMLQLTAADADGTSLFQGAVAPIGSAQRPVGVPAPKRAVIDAEPGGVRTEMTISDGGARLLDRDVRFLEIPNLYAAEVTITAPEILRTLTARQFRELAADLDAPPTTVREFSRFERLLIRVHAYGPGDVPPRVTATLVNAIGQPLYALGHAGDMPDGMVQFDLPLSAFARGNYAIRITATSGTLRASQLIQIRVIG